VLTPIDSAAFAYQLADLKRVDRLVALRLPPFAFLDFEFCGFDVTRTTRTLERTKHPPLAKQSALY